MATKLDHPLKRELLIRKIPHMLTIDPRGLKLTVKGRRIGQELLWEDLVSGQAALAVALNASLEVESGKRPSRQAAGRKRTAEGKQAAEPKPSRPKQAAAKKGRRDRVRST